MQVADFFTRHTWVYLYQERMVWKDINEMVFDLFFDEQSNDKEVFMYNLMSDLYDSIGVACDCHADFGKYCIIEFAKEIVPKSDIQFVQHP